MPTTDIASLHELPDRVSMSGPGLKAKATDAQWDVLSKQAVATYICTEDGEPCEECAQYCGEEMRLPEAEEKIPQHPNCRCWYEWSWDPELSSLSMTALTTRASGSDTTIMHDTVTKTTSTTDASIVSKTPTSDDEDGEYIRVPISSTGTDRDGDSFSEKGLKDLRDQIRETSKPVFENHGIGEGGLFGIRYDWKGIIGSQDDAEIEADGDEQTLYSFVKPNGESEEGQLFRSYVDAGMPVGLSIGFRPLDYESNDDDENVFHETDLLETSAVGIQSNQESVAGRSGSTVEALAKSAGEFDADLDEETLAQAIVSEAFARGAGGTGAVAGEPLDTREAATETKDTTTMSDSDTDDNEEYLTRSEAEDMFEKYLGDSEDESESESESESKDDDGDSELKELAKQNHEAIEELKDAVEGGEAEDADTTNKAEKDAAEGEETDGEGGESEEKAVPEKGWM